MSTILQRVPLGFQWPTVDPFLFCVHHLDEYPIGNELLGPAASLDGREIGSDFEARDGWRMYHGHEVPGFPQHPHRGFETVTYVRQGLVDHSDSLGAAARYGRGDVQWLTAGSGIVHAEMFPLLESQRPNPAELFQIWVNLARADKMADPFFTMLWAEDIPHLIIDREGRRHGEITVIAGTLEGLAPPPPPPDSWASRVDSDLAIWHVVLQPGGSWIMPAATSTETVRMAYLFAGSGADFDQDRLLSATGAHVRSDRPVTVKADPDSPDEVQILILQGRPISEPVAQYGPFVMNDRAGIEQAFADYRQTGFGGWPWHRDDPTHGHEPLRFARRPDGLIETPSRSQEPAESG